jgi:1-phosphatidylinositol-3-phosphate 5-kinase
VDYVFELRVPRLQMTVPASVGVSKVRERERGREREREKEKEREQEKDGDGDVEKRELRREIKKWWEGVADHMDTLVGRFFCWEGMALIGLIFI